jgi:hypothetical protein
MKVTINILDLILQTFKYSFQVIWVINIKLYLENKKKSYINHINSHNVTNMLKDKNVKFLINNN